MQSPPLRVLVLNDNFFQRAITVNMLRQLGCEPVFSSSSAHHALHTLHSVGPVDIALCDMQRGGLDNLDFLQRAAEDGLVRSVIINSSLAEDIRRAVGKLMPLLGLRMLGELGQPLQFDTLSRLLKSHLSPPTSPAGFHHAHLIADEDEVCCAVRQGQMETYFQPKINLLNNQAFGVEALTRWNHPSSGLVSPAVFMPTIERCDLLNELFFAQLDHGLQLQRYFLMHGLPLNVAFNLQPSQLCDVTLVSRIKATLASFKLPGAGVTFELTETGLVEASAICMENLVRLRMMGCRLSIDDFGSGFSSLQRLCQLPFNEIKLDGEFVQALGGDPRCRAVISSTLALGKSLGMTVVAEGIETQEQHHQLIDLGCVQGQGYFFAKPMTRDELCVWFHSRKHPPEERNEPLPITYP
ncbi:EAL domain-containing response regulator [Pseudomonas sp. 15FMM2]|uniref:EAL domain-containing response regulator n=1 Tax=Pseudomonas imrae TaxID=2992837 RepID=A0ACC7P736_9PSED